MNIANERIIVVRTPALVLLLSLFLCQAAFGQASQFSSLAIAASGRPIPNASVAVCQGAPTTAAAVSSNVATLTMASNPVTAGFTLSSTIVIAGFAGTDSYFNGSFTVSAVSSTQIQFALTHANSAATSNGSVVQQGATSAQSCLPVATLFTDATASTIGSNPVSSDGLGNVVFYANPGLYFVQYYGSSVTTRIFPTILPPSSSTTSYVGGATGSGGDIMAQISAAYASVSTGSTIAVLPQAGGGCYLTNATVNLNTVGKYVTIRGTAPPTQSSGQITGGSCIQFTHVTAATAFNVDWSPAAGGGYVASAAFQDLAIVNSATEGGSTQCTTVGGCGSLATGINIPGANSGAMLANWQNLTIKGFGLGFGNAGNSGVGWGGLCVNCSLASNTTGATFNSTEGFAFIGGSISTNGTGVKLNNGGSVNNISFTGTHFDSNTAFGIDGTTGGSCGIVSLNSVHFENLGPVTTHYANCSGGVLMFSNVDAQDDGGAGNTNGAGCGTGTCDYWFTGNNIAGSIAVSTGGRLVTAMFVPGTAADLRVVNGNPATLTGTLGACAGGTNCNISIIGSSINASVTTAQLNQSQATQYAGNTSCAANVKTVTFNKAYTSTPIVMLSDRTTKGGINLTAASGAGFSVSCTGATDNFDWLAIGNPN